MKHLKKIFILFSSIITFYGCDDEQTVKTLTLLNVYVDNLPISLNEEITGQVPIDRPITFVFSQGVDKKTAQNAISLRNDNQFVDINLVFLNQNETIAMSPVGVLNENTTYTISISGSLKGANGEAFEAMEIQFKTTIGELEIESIHIGDKHIQHPGTIQNIPLDISMALTFSSPVDRNTIAKAANLTGAGVSRLQFTFSDNDQTVLIKTSGELGYYKKFTLSIDSSLRGIEGEKFTGFSTTIYTALDSTKKFPEISDKELLTKIQKQTFRYFWDFGHPVSGLARERNTSGDVVTSGGSGFGIMAVIVGIERGFITRAEGMERFETIIDFLASADRFHGAWSHWLNGNTGKVIPFSANDNGGDLVETSFLAMGFITVRQYLNPLVTAEKNLINKINVLLDAIEWDWYTQNDNSLTWHWSPNYGFEKNHIIRGWNEALITYVMAASSKNHAITRDVYDQGWARNGNMLNGGKFYGITLPLGPNYGGPLFFEHYSFLGIDPRNLQDQYAQYWNQAVNHTHINQKHCAINPLNYVGYSEDCWGLTASDGNQGYSAHSPTNDQGVIAPTAAVSSIPFTPEASMKAIKHFYYMLGDRLWGPYGFYDAFNITAEWYTTSNIAIDQGPIILMIENYRTGLLWQLFMSAPEIQHALTKLGFSY